MSICYYCQGNHKPSSCTRYAQDQTTAAIRKETNSIEKLGYQQLSKLDDLASTYRESSKEVSKSIEDLSDRIEQSLDDISLSIGEVVDALNIHHSELMFKMDQQLNFLAGISNMIEYGLATEANERLEQAMRSFKSGVLDDSMRLLNDAIEKDPTDFRIYILQGHVYIRKDDYENALNRFERALSYAVSAPHKSSYIQLLISRAYYCTGNIEKAIKSIKKAIELNPGEMEFNYQYATYISQKHK